MGVSRETIVLGGLPKKGAWAVCMFKREFAFGEKEEGCF